MKGFIYTALFLSVSLFSSAQSRSYTDAAQMYNRMLLENSNSLIQIGNYKVRGTPFFYGGKLKGNLFVHNVPQSEVYINYNTYDQAVEYSTSADAQSLKPDGNVDSFIISKNADLEIPGDLLFVNGKYLFDEEGFYQKVFAGPRYSLFKKYRSELAVVSTNYVQSELRQFDLNVEYFYSDTASQELKKIKPNTSFLKKEFKGKIDVISIAGNEDFAYNPGNALIKIFEALNK